MAQGMSDHWRREPMTARQVLDTVLAWAAVLAAAGAVFAGLFWGIASLE
jgi:hypothetical protein